MPRVLDWLIGPPEVRPPAATSVRPPTVRAAGRVAVAPTFAGPGSGWGVGGEFLAPVSIDTAMGGAFIGRTEAMTIPTVSRARDLLCSAVGALPLTLWQVHPPDVELQQPPLSWMGRPDPNRTRQWMLAWTTDDLFFYGAAYWQITARMSTTYPAAFRRLEVTEVHVDDSGRVTHRGEDIDPADLVEFLSPIEGLLGNGWRALSIALNLDDAADRFAGHELPNGVLEEQDNGAEDLTQSELTEMAGTFAAARRLNTIAATNKYVKFREVSTDPSKMQIVEGRQYQALEMARLGNVPAYLVGAPAGTGMTYQNTAQARADLIDFGAIPYIGCIEQTLSGPNVTVRDQAVRLDLNAWLRNPFTGPDAPAASANDIQQAVVQNPAGADGGPP